MGKIWEKRGAKFGPIMDQNWTKYSHEPMMGKIWAKYDQHIKLAIYGQNMDHKLDQLWAK